MTGGRNCGVVSSMPENIEAIDGARENKLAIGRHIDWRLLEKCAQLRNRRQRTHRAQHVIYQWQWAIGEMKRCW